VICLDKIAEIADQFENIRMEVLIRPGADEGQSQDLRSRVENYLRSTGKEELNQKAFSAISRRLEDPEAGFEALSDRSV